MIRFYALFLALGLLLTMVGRDAAAQDRALYAVQLRTSGDRMLVTSLRDSLTQAGLPAYVVPAEAGGAYRLHLGPFHSREDARQLAAFHGFTDFRITDASAGRGAFPRVVTRVIVDAVSMEPAPPYVYLGERHSMVLVRQLRAPKAVTPPRTLLYVPGRDRPLHIRHMTGFEETDTALLFGAAERVFVNPDGHSLDTFSEEVERFSRETGLSLRTTQDGLAFYNDSVAVRFTTLHAYSFVQDTLLAYARPGFDYVNAEGERLRLTGRVTRRRAILQGHAHAWRLLPRGEGNLDAGRTALYVRPTERRDTMTLCIAFLDPVRGERVTRTSLPRR